MIIIIILIITNYLIVIIYISDSIFTIDKNYLQVSSYNILIPAMVIKY